MTPLATRHHQQEPGHRKAFNAANHARGERHGRAKLNSRRVRILRRRWRWRHPVYGVKAFARRWGCAPEAIQAALEHRTWKHVA